MSMTVRSRTTARPPRADPEHPRVVPILDSRGGNDEAVDQPFAEGAQDAIDPDLRHRMISEAAYYRYAERGYDDGYDMEDWLEAEAEVDHVLTGRRASGDEGTVD